MDKQNGKGDHRVGGMALLNGHLVPENQAVVSVYDGGWLHGAGLFETLRAENRRVFRLEAHVDRLRYSAEHILRPIERDSLPSAEALQELLAVNQLSSARIRITLTAGTMRLEADQTTASLTVSATASPLAAYGDTLYERGVPVALCDYRVSPSDPLAGHKTTSYLGRLLGLRAAQARQCLEALWFTTNNHLAEGSISNVFLITAGTLRTPPLNTPVLPGITRGIVLELARQMEIPHREEPLTINDLLDAREVFLTNAIMQIMPVVRVERHDIADGKVGPVTRRLLNAYRELVLKECPPT